MINEKPQRLRGKGLEIGQRQPQLELAPALGAMAIPGVILTRGNLRGDLVRRKNIQSNIDYARELEAELKIAGSYESLLSGESSVSDQLKGQSDIPVRAILNIKGVAEKRYIGFGAALADHDYRELGREHPKERYKFYSSFDLTTPEQIALGGKWFDELTDKAYEHGLTLTTKSFDHAYDSLNIYTWHPAEMAAIISELYPKYEAQGLYYATPHFYQGNIDGVDPRHVGFVQEPADAGYSHSSRMGRLGRVLDEAMAHGAAVTLDVFTNAAKQAGVDPERPYLVNQ